MLDLVQSREVRFDFRKSVRNGQLFAEENFVGLLQGALGFFGNVVSFQTHFINRARRRGIAICEHVGRDVLNDFGAAADNRVSPDSAELVDRREAANDGVVFDHHMTGERRDVRHDHVISERDIMRDVAVGENVIARANGRVFAIGSAAVDCHVLAKGVVVANLRVSRAAFPFQVLRFQANAREGKNLIAAAECRVAVDHHVRMQLAVVAEFHVLADDAIRPNMARRRDLRLRMNNGGGMNHLRRRRE